MRVWILQTGEPLHIDTGNPRPMRAMNLSDVLISAGHKVVLWTSAFHHQEKRHRSRSADRITISPNFEIRLIPSPGYRRHIGLGRLWDHAILARNLSNLLARESNPPDVAFVGYPPIETAAVMTRWLKTRGVPSILDAKDQWPAIFLEVSPRPLQTVARIVFAPYFFLAQRAMRDATALSAISDNFLQWAAKFAGRPIGEFDRVFPLTSPSGQVPKGELATAREWWDERGVCLDEKPRICFVGSHTTAFDFARVVEAAKALENRNFVCDFIICGDGPSSQEWRDRARNLSNIHFVGWIDRAQIEVLAELSLAALAPYKNTKNFVMSVPNKVIDSLSLGLPILSPLEGEVANLIDWHGVGLGYGERTGKTLAECIELLVANPDLQSSLSERTQALYRSNFEFNMVYEGLVNHLEVLAQRGRRRGA